MSPVRRIIPPRKRKRVEGELEETTAVRTKKSKLNVSDDTKSVQDKPNGPGRKRSTSRSEKQSPPVEPSPPPPPQEIKQKPGPGSSARRIARSRDELNRVRSVSGSVSGSQGSPSSQPRAPTRDLQAQLSSSSQKSTSSRPGDIKIRPNFIRIPTFNITASEKTPDSSLEDYVEVDVPPDTPVEPPVPYFPIRPSSRRQSSNHLVDFSSSEDEITQQSRPYLDARALSAHTAATAMPPPPRPRPGKSKYVAWPLSRLGPGTNRILVRPRESVEVAVSEDGMSVWSTPSSVGTAVRMSPMLVGLGFVEGSPSLGRERVEDMRDERRETMAGVEKSYIEDSMVDETTMMHEDDEEHAESSHEAPVPKTVSHAPSLPAPNKSFVSVESATSVPQSDNSAPVTAVAPLKSPSLQTTATPITPDRPSPLAALHASNLRSILLPPSSMNLSSSSFSTPLTRPKSSPHVVPFNTSVLTAPTHTAPTTASTSGIALVSARPQKPLSRLSPLSPAKLPGHSATPVFTLRPPPVSTPSRSIPTFVPNSLPRPFPPSTESPGPFPALSPQQLQQKQKQEEHLKWARLIVERKQRAKLPRKPVEVGDENMLKSNGGLVDQVDKEKGPAVGNARKRLAEGREESVIVRAEDQRLLTTATETQLVAVERLGSHESIVTHKVDVVMDHVSESESEEHDTQTTPHSTPSLDQAVTLVLSTVHTDATSVPVPVNHRMLSLAASTVDQSSDAPAPLLLKPGFQLTMTKKILADSQPIHVIAESQSLGISLITSTSDTPIANNSTYPTLSLHTRSTFDSPPIPLPIQVHNRSSLTCPPPSPSLHSISLTHCRNPSLLPLFDLLIYRQPTSSSPPTGVSPFALNPDLPQCSVDTYQRMLIPGTGLWFTGNPHVGWTFPTHREDGEPEAWFVRQQRRERRCWRKKPFCGAMVQASRGRVNGLSDREIVYQGIGRTSREKGRRSEGKLSRLLVSSIPEYGSMTEWQRKMGKGWDSREIETECWCMIVPDRLRDRTRWGEKIPLEVWKSKDV